MKEAKDWLNRAEKERENLGRLSFLKGLILLKERKEKEALKAFKKAKELDPSFSQSSDIQIARIYARQKRFSEAKESLKAVITVDPTSETASFAKEYEDALSRTVKQYKPWSVTAGVAYQYDDNSLLKPIKRIPLVNISGEKDSSIITTLRFVYTPLMKDPWVFAGQYASYTNSYFDNHRLNLIHQSISLTPGYQFNQGMLTLPVSFSYLWLREREYMHLTQAKPMVHYMFSPDHFVQLSAGYTRREMLRTPPNHDRNEERDGNIWSLSPGYLHPFRGGKGLLFFYYEFSKDDTEGKNWENRGNRFTLGMIFPVFEKVSLSGSGDLFLQDYKNTHTFYGMERSDRIYYGDDFCSCFRKPLHQLGNLISTPRPSSEPANAFLINGGNDDGIRGFEAAPDLKSIIVEPVFEKLGRLEFDPHEKTEEQSDSNPDEEGEAGSTRYLHLFNPSHLGGLGGFDGVFFSWSEAFFVRSFAPLPSKELMSESVFS